ncbi:MAG TPA: hypothetical protein VNX68_01520 [Nitrosopumilaceae archaeon]|jgi:hypothetical protein|nr:hypothetical protein [Nitrosopumilaceae archaeon]
MESPKKITKAQLIEAIRREIDFQERKKLLENKVSNINEELKILTEEEKEEESIEEGIFQNVKRAIGNTVSGVGKVGQAVTQKFQQGADQNKLQNITTDIKAKEQEISNLKNSYKHLTGQNYSTKTAQSASPVARNQQGVVKQQQKVIAKPVAQPVASVVKPIRNKSIVKNNINPNSPRQVARNK